jgi:hypothetical protein
MGQMDIDKLVLQSLKSQICFNVDLIRHVAHQVCFIQLPLIMNLPSSGLGQDNHSLFSRAPRDVLASMPFLLIRVTLFYHSRQSQIGTLSNLQVEAEEM